MKGISTMAIALVTLAQASAQGNVAKEWAVSLSGGHSTDQRDHGRPVVLVAGGLGVKPEVFREAFSHVTPAPGGREPDPRQVQENKQALLSRLGQFGVTNELLDRVSNYYRYRPQQGELWPTKEAKIEATVVNGKLMGFKVVDGGSGYSSAPTISVAGHPEVQVEVVLTYGKDLKKNGSISEVKLKS